MYTKCLEEHLLVSTLKLLLIIFKLFASISFTFTQLVFYISLSPQTVIIFSKPEIPTYLALGANFTEDNFSTDQGEEGWSGDDSSALPEKAMATHSNTLAWKIPWTEEPGGLQSMGQWRVGHDWATSLWLFTFMHWRRKLQPTSMFFPGESQGQRSLVGCRLWGHTESDTTEVT